MGLSFSQRVGLRLGIEELADGATGEEGEVGGTAVLPDAPEETVEGGLNEMAEVEAEVEENTAEAEAVEQSVETLEKIVSGLQNSMKNGGCTTGEAYAYQVALESAFAPFGIGRSASASLENIGSSRNPRLEATRVTLENAGVVLKNFWDSLVALWNKVYNSVKGWLMKIFDTIPAAKKRAQEILDKANKTKGTPSKEKISFSASPLATGKNSVDGASVVAATAEVKNFADANIKENDAAYDSVTTTLVKILTDFSTGKGDEAEEEALVKKIYDEITSTYQGLTDASKEKYGGDDLKAKISTAYMGNKVVAVTFSESITKDSKSIGIAKLIKAYSAKLTDGPVEANSDKEIGAATVDQVKAIATTAIGICDSLSKYRAQWQKRDSSKKDLSTKVDKIIKDAAKEKENEASKTKRIKDCATALQSYASKSTNVSAQVSSYGLRCVQTALNYANKSLDNISESGAKKEENKPAA